MNWTKELPSESGYYWFRFGPDDGRPEVALWDNAERQLHSAGSDWPLPADDKGDPLTKTIADCDGEFWPEKLSPPV